MDATSFGAPQPGPPKGPPPYRPWPYVQAAAGLLVRGDRIVLVKQRRNSGLVWSPPGGGVEPGELLPEAAAREVFEETGLTVGEVGPLAYIVNTTTSDYPSAVIFFFEITEWSGQIAITDPEILDCILVDRTTAAALVEDTTAPRREIDPLLAYPHGTPAMCPVWTYRDDVLVGRRFPATSFHLLRNTP